MAEHRIVAPKVMGSSPIGHPNSHLMATGRPQASAAAARPWAKLPPGFSAAAAVPSHSLGSSRRTSRSASTRWMLPGRAAR